MASQYLQNSSTVCVNVSKHLICKSKCQTLLVLSVTALTSSPIPPFFLPCYLHNTIHKFNFPSLSVVDDDFCNMLLLEGNALKIAWLLSAADIYARSPHKEIGRGQRFETFLIQTINMLTSFLEHLHVCLRVWMWPAINEKASSSSFNTIPMEKVNFCPIEWIQSLHNLPIFYLYSCWWSSLSILKLS